MHLLQAVLEHWAVHFFEQVTVELDPVFRRDGDDVLVVGRVVDLAEAEPVLDRGLSGLLAVAHDVGRVE